MLLVVYLLDTTAALGLVDRYTHTIGNRITVHNNRAIDMASSTPDRLDKRTLATQKAFLIGVHNCNQTYFRQVNSLAQ